MSISIKIKRLYRTILSYRLRKSQRRYILSIMEKNHIPNESVEGENEFLQKWNILGGVADVVNYRCFSKYLGNNPNLLSGSLCVQFIEPLLNPIRYRDYYEDKNVFGKLYPKEWMPKTFLRKMNGIFMDEDYNLVEVTDSNILSYVNNVDKFILKPTVDSCSGRSISLFHKENGRYVNQNGHMFTLDYVNQNYGNDFIIQACLEQSDYMSQFNPTSVNTIRLTVYRSVKDNSLHVTNGIIRIGASKAVVDNAHSGGKFCGIDLNGNLNKYVCETYGEKSEIFNGINFNESKFQIPNFEEVKRFAINIVKEIPHHRIIALDIALDKTNTPKLIEYNIGAYSYWLFQFSGQVALDGFTDEIIDYCKKHNNYTIASIKI